MKSFGKILAVAAILACAPTPLFACAACGSENSQINSPLAEGMNWGILTLMSVLVVVLVTCFLALVHLIRKSETLNAAAENSSKPAQV